MFGNIVRTYDEERTICDVIKHRDKYDGETFKVVESSDIRLNDQYGGFQVKVVGKLDNVLLEENH